MKSRGLELLAFAAAGALLSAAPSNAAMLVLDKQSFDYFGASLDASAERPAGGELAVVPDSASFSDTLTFAKFDPSLGVLARVNIGLFSEVESYVEVTADPQGTANGFGGDAQLDVGLRVSVDGLGEVFSYSDSHPVGCTGAISIDSGCSESFFVHDDFTGFYTTTEPGVLGNFVKTGSSSTFGIAGLADLLLTITSCSGLADQPEPTAIGMLCSAQADFRWGEGTPLPEMQVRQIAVSYEYEPRVVAEPATLTLFGLGLAGLGASRRKKLV